MRGLVTLIGVAVVAYRSGQQNGHVSGFMEGVGKTSAAFVEGVRRAER